jgi:PAS domain S-box-containing protein
MTEKKIDDFKKKIAELEAEIVQGREREKIIQKSLERYKELVEMLPETVYEMDLTGKLTFVNQRSYERFGYTQEDFEKGLNAFSMIIPEDWNNARENIAKIIGGGKGPNEYTALRKDGTTFKAKFYSSVIYDEDNPVGLRGFIIDITELKEVEDALRKEHNALLKTMSEVKILRGLIPICSVCKKIRDDKGYWNQIESYIRDHSEAQFSHGICPPCAEKLYGHLIKSE